MLDDLKVMLPSVTKIIIIGWSAGEQHFIKLLDEAFGFRLDQLHISIIDKNRHEANKLRESLVKSFGYKAFNCLPFDGGGFSEFAASKTLTDILRA